MGTTNVDIPATNVRVINRGGVTGDEFTSELGDMSPPGDVAVFGGGFTTPTTNFFIVQWGSQPVDTFTLPVAPPGFPNLEGAFYTCIAYRNSSESHSGFPTPSFGLEPEPEDSPFLQAAEGSPMVIDHISLDSYAGLVVGRASDLLSLEAGTFANQWRVGTWNGSTFNDATIHLGYFGIRLVYNDGGATAPTVVPPLRKHPRNDGLGTSTAARKWPPPPTIQASNRRGPTAII